MSVLTKLTASMLIALAMGPALPAQSPDENSKESSKTAPVRTDQPETVPGFAVVELFTSQGCSSCPPADATLRRIAEAAKKTGRPVFTLSFHVDYWNRLGWKDPYSDAAFSYRQRSYARAAESNRIYTPQMIVGGNVEFNGADGRKAIRAIVTELNREPEVQLQLKLNKTENQHLLLDYSINGSFQGKRLFVAVVSTPEPTEVEQGENAGRTLAHVDVVRELRSVPLDEPGKRSEGQIEVPIPVMEGHVDGKVIAFIQAPASPRIVGAAALALPPTAPDSDDGTGRDET